MSGRAAVLVLLLVPAGGFAQVVQEHGDEHVATRNRPASGQEPDLARVAELIVQQANAFRKQQGRGPLQTNAKLTAAADYFAKYLARTNKFSHTADGTQPWDRVKKFGYDYAIVAENIAYEYDSAGFTSEALARKLMEGWEQSPGHRKNLLDPDVTEIGVAVARSPETGYYYAVQDFARPASERQEFKITNDADATIRYQVAGRTYPLPPHYTRTHTLSRPADVTFQWPGAGPAVRPSNGAHLDVVRDETGQFRVKKE